MNDNGWQGLGYYVFFITAVEAALIVVAIYSLGYWLLKRTILPKSRYVTPIKGVVLVIATICFIPFYIKQIDYIQTSRANPSFYPCNRVLCLDNYFPVKGPSSKLKTGQLNFDTYVLSPPPPGFHLRFVDTSGTAVDEIRAKGQPHLSIEYVKDEEATSLLETQYSPAIQAELQNFALLPGTVNGMTIYSGGSSDFAAVKDGTVVFVSYPDTSIASALRKVPPESLSYMPYGKSN